MPLPNLRASHADTRPTRIIRGFPERSESCKAAQRINRLSVRVRVLQPQQPPSDCATMSCSVLPLQPRCTRPQLNRRRRYYARGLRIRGYFHHGSAYSSLRAVRSSLPSSPVSSIVPPPRALVPFVLRGDPKTATALAFWCLEEDLVA
jgi:hypothetical protein